MLDHLFTVCWRIKAGIVACPILSRLIKVTDAVLYRPLNRQRQDIAKSHLRHIKKYWNKQKINTMTKDFLLKRKREMRRRPQKVAFSLSTTVHSTSSLFKIFFMSLVKLSTLARMVKEQFKWSETELNWASACIG